MLQASWKIITESEDVIKFLKYLAVVNFDDPPLMMQPQIGKNVPTFIFIQQIFNK